jgi:hypothetical protein
VGSLDQPTRISVLVRRPSTMESQISARQTMLEKMKRPFVNNRRFNRYWNSIQLNLTRNSGYYALVSSLMCLCLIGLRSNGEYHDHDEIDSELHYSFHNWEPKVIVHSSFNDLFTVSFTELSISRVVILLQKPMEIHPRERVSYFKIEFQLITNASNAFYVIPKPFGDTFWFFPNFNGITRRFLCFWFSDVAILNFDF